MYRTIKAVVASRENLTTASSKKILGKIGRIFYFKEGICEEKNATVLSAKERLTMVAVIGTDDGTDDGTDETDDDGTNGWKGRPPMDII